MSNGAPIHISDVPKHVVLEGGVPLASWLHQVNKVADSSKASDGEFTQENFNRLCKMPEYKGLNRFKTFDKFKEYLTKYIASQQCDDPEIVSKIEAYNAENEIPAYCVNPAPPKLPPLQKKKQKPKGPDLSAFKPEYPQWYDEPYEPAPAKEGIGMPSLEEQIAAVWPSPLEEMTENLPDTPVSSDTSTPWMYVGYDGEYFRFDRHCCHVELEDLFTCISDWSYCHLYATNNYSGETAVDKADIYGLGSVKVKAEPNDTISIHAEDHFTGELSIFTRKYRIEKDGSVKLVKMYLNYDIPKDSEFLKKTSDDCEDDEGGCPKIVPHEYSKAEKAARAIGTVIPQLGALMMLFINPKLLKLGNYQYPEDYGK